MNDQWSETLRCPVCGKTGMAGLTQDDDDAPTAQLVPDGFKVVGTKYVPDFYCSTCDVAVDPLSKAASVGGPFHRCEWPKRAQLLGAGINRWDRSAQCQMCFPASVKAKP